MSGGVATEPNAQTQALMQKQRDYALSQGSVDTAWPSHNVEVVRSLDNLQPENPHPEGSPEYEQWEVKAFVKLAHREKECAVSGGENMDLDQRIAAMYEQKTPEYLKFKRAVEAIKGNFGLDQTQLTQLREHQAYANDGGTDELVARTRNGRVYNKALRTFETASSEQLVYKTVLCDVPWRDITISWLLRGVKNKEFTLDDVSQHIENMSKTLQQGIKAGIDRVDVVSPARDSIISDMNEKKPTGQSPDVKG